MSAMDWGDLATVLRPAKRLNYNGTSVASLVTGLAPRPMYRMNNDNEFTRGKRVQQYGPRQSAAKRLMRAAVLNQDYIKFQFKGLGRPYQYGFYNVEKYTFVDTDTYWALPLYAFDLTSLNNIIGGSYFGCNPMLRAYRNQTQGKIEWHVCQGQNRDGLVAPTSLTLTKGMADVNANDIAVYGQWNPISYNNSGTAGIAPHNVQYIDTIDIGLNLFAARQVPTTWKIDVRQFDDSLGPYNQYGSKLQNCIVDVEDDQWHNAFWSGEMMTLVNHPLNNQRGNRVNPVSTGGAKYDLRRQFGTKGFKSLLPKPILVTQQPKDTSYSEPSTATGSRMHYEKIVLKLRKAVNMARSTAPTNTVLNAPSGTDAAASTTGGNQDVNVTSDASFACYPNPSQRIWLTIMSNDFDDKTFNVTTLAPCRAGAAPAGATVDCWATKINDIPAEIGTHVDFNKSGSFDLNVIKTIIRDAL